MESIRHATVLVGLDKMRIWASLIVFSGLEDTPRDVLVTGAVAEHLDRRWIAVELVEEYAKGSKFRFEKRAIESILTSNHVLRRNGRKAIREKQSEKLPLFDRV